MLLLVSIPAQATSLYFEAGPGVSQLLNSAGLFGDIADGQHSIGMGLNFMLGLNLAKSDLSGFQLHFGPKYFYLTSGNDEATFVYQAVYPALRFEFRRFYFGGGVTPIVFASQSSTAFSPPHYNAFITSCVWRVWFTLASGPVFSFGC